MSTKSKIELSKNKNSDKSAQPFCQVNEHVRFLTIANHCFDINQINSVTYFPGTDRKHKTQKKEWVERIESRLDIVFKNNDTIPIFGVRYIKEFKQCFEQHFDCQIPAE